jgi:hypothetical protein
LRCRRRNGPGRRRRSAAGSRWLGYCRSRCRGLQRKRARERSAGTGTGRRHRDPLPGRRCEFTPLARMEVSHDLESRTSAGRTNVVRASAPIPDSSHGSRWSFDRPLDTGPSGPGKATTLQNGRQPNWGVTCVNDSAAESRDPPTRRCAWSTGTRRRRSPSTSACSRSSCAFASSGSGPARGLTPFAKFTVVNDSPPGTATGGFAFVNPLVGAWYAFALGSGLRASAFAGVTIPVLSHERSARFYAAFRS